MAGVKLGYEDFISTVSEGDRPFVEELHGMFTDRGCKIEVKEAKSGCVVSYTYNKKTVANYVFRKSGLITRIYGNHVAGYMEFLDTMPENMIESVAKAPSCRRLLNPEDCNPKCSMGYDFIMKGQRHQKCRINAFMFLVSPENNSYIKGFLEKELQALKAGM